MGRGSSERMCSRPTRRREHADVFRHRIQRHRIGFGDFRHAEIAAAEPLHDGAPGGIGEGRESGVNGGFGLDHGLYSTLWLNIVATCFRCQVHNPPINLASGGRVCHKARAFAFAALRRRQQAAVAQW